MSIELLPARMLNEFVYCPRLFHIEYVQGDFEDSHDTIAGRWEHRRVDKESCKDDDGFGKMTSITLSSETHRLIAKMDLIELEDGKVTPVDYKHGKKPDTGGGAWDTDLVQICAQAIILRDNGFDCEQGAIYYKRTKERVYVPITDALVEMTLLQAEKARLVAEGNVPPPLIDSPKCVGCSLAGICLPDETNSLELTQMEEDTDERIRRLYPARDDAAPAYVMEQGAVVAKKGEELVVKKGGEVIGSVRLMELSHLSVHGNVQVTTQAIHGLCERNIPIYYMSTGGWFYGTTLGTSHKNVQLRMAQYRHSADEKDSLDIAKSFIEGKVRNCRTMLRRNCSPSPQAALEVLAEIIDNIWAAKDAMELLGLEGSASRVYFGHFRDMLSPEAVGFNMESRNRRPPRDPVNAMLSFTYALLAKDCTNTLLSIGFDPYLGFLHRPKYGKPALALDLMEEFRPIICDSTVISCINNREVCRDDFIKTGNAVSFTSSGKRTLVRAYERRMDTLIRHPLFKYTVSYRRILEVQGRLIARYLSGEIERYPPFCTR